MSSQPPLDLVIEQPRCRLHGSGVEIAACLRWGWKRHLIAFRMTGRTLPERVEPFLALALFPAMKLGLRLVTEAGCSPLFLANLERIQAKFLGWEPSLKAVEVCAPTSPQVAPAQPRRVEAFFSGGVDSFHTLFRHHDQISDLIFVHGFDIPVRDEAFYHQTAASYENLVTARNKRLNPKTAVASEASPLG